MAIDDRAAAAQAGCCCSSAGSRTRQRRAGRRLRRLAVVIRRAEVADHPWIIAIGAEAYRDLGDYTRILPSWLEQPGVLAWIDHDLQGRGRGFAMLGFYMEGGSPSAEVVADLLALAVLPAFQRRGIGSKLLAHVPTSPRSGSTPAPASASSMARRATTAASARSGWCGR
ncbi:MAG: GNAT family N-acetyltransferase [Deltaproteobacteria bacterium]|nr:MAG: GNAT family N-acetyltransferase [Deltaproteobacteria bacterium]